MKKLVLALFSATFLFSCSSDDDGKNPNKKTGEEVVTPVDGKIKFSKVKEEKINAQAFDKWVYYSIEKGKIVDVKDFKNSLDWDIAFHRYDVRLNGGKSGKGKGEALKIDASGLAEVKEVPKNAKFVKDDIGSVTISYTTGNAMTEDQPFSQLMTWVKFAATGGGPTYEMVPNTVFLIKTASGKYAKIRFISYLNDRGRGGLVTWKYAVQEK